MKEFTLMLLAHSLGDYYFQPARLSEAKSKSIFYVLIHAAIYAATMFSTLLIYYSEAYLYALATASLTHALIDIVKQLVINGRAKAGILTVREERAMYLADQVLHMAIILACAFFSANAGAGSDATFVSETLPRLTNADGYALIGVVTALLSVMKPANVFIRKVLVTEKPGEAMQTRLRHGGNIGNLERLIIIVFMCLGQYAAIAIVFTAKSIVRFKDFENRSFAEYYLYGTLMSVVTAIAVFMLLKIFGEG